MKIAPVQLQAQLKKQLVPVYLIAGDEPLQALESADAIRAAAQARGFSERTVITLENQQFDWKTLTAEANNLSLFASQKLLEIRLGTKVPGDKNDKNFTNAEVFLNYLQQPVNDTIVLLTLSKLDKKQQKNAWFQALDKVGAIIQVAALDAAQMPAWIQQRLSQHGLHAEREAVTILAERAEGHLLAAAQEVEKLRLLYPEGQLSAEQVLEAVADHARFEVFAWLDTILSGNVPRVMRQLHSLRASGVEIFLIITLLERDVRMLCQVAYALHNGQAMPHVLKEYRIWGARQKLVPQAVKRLRPQAWLALLGQTARIDLMFKGLEAGDPWDAVLRVAIQVSGHKIFKPNTL